MAETQAQGQPQAAVDAAAEVSLLDQIVDQGRLGRDAAAKERGKDLVKNFVTEVLEGTMTIAADTEAMINARIAQIDAPDLDAAQRDHAPPRLPEAGRHLARAEVPARQQRDGRAS